MMTNGQFGFDFDSRPKIGLALGSGSARGLAHFGVIRALAEAGIEVEFIAGTSIGALVGAVYSAGRIDALEATFRSMDRKKTRALFDFVLPKSGLLDGARLSKLVHEHIQVNGIEALPILFHAVATDIQSGEEVVIRTGDIIKAVRASASVPGIFTPVRSNGRLLVDGGLVNPVPASTVRAMGANIVIAVDVNHHIVAGRNLIPIRAKNAATSNTDKMLRMVSRWAGEYGMSSSYSKPKQRVRGASVHPSVQPSLRDASEESLPSIFEVLLASINIMEALITRSHFRIARPDVIIQPPLGHIRFLEFHRADEIISIGYESARRQLAAQLPNLLNAKLKLRKFHRNVAGKAEDCANAGDTKKSHVP